RVSSDSRISASSSMMRILPALGGVLSGVLRRERAASSDIATSDMDCLPDQRKIQGEGGCFARAALHAYISRVFLDDAVGDRKSKTGAAILFLFFSSRRRHTRLVSDWSSDVCSSDLTPPKSVEPSATTHQPMAVP